MALSLALGHMLVLTETGDILVCGGNSHGELGVGDLAARARPVFLRKSQNFNGEDIVMVCAESMSSAGVSREGNLFVWGGNASGELGVGYNSPYALSPVRIDRHSFGNTPVVMVANGMCFSVVLTAQGHVYTTGENSGGSLGHGDRINRNTFTRIDPASFDNLEIGMIATGPEHVLALTRHGCGSLYTWGPDGMGETGQGHLIATSARTLTPTKLPAGSFDNVAVSMMDADWHYSVVVSRDGVLWGTGFRHFGRYTMHRLGGEETFGGGGVRMAACGIAFTLIVTRNNTLWKLRSHNITFDSAPYHIEIQPFDQDLFAGEDVMVAAAGSKHSAVLTTQGRLYAWDDSSDTAHQLHGFDILTNVPQRIVMDFPATLRFGRWHAPCSEVMLAFVMGSHAHLAAPGARTAYSDADGDFDEDLLRLIMQQMHLRSRPGTSDGFQDIIGRLL